MTRTIVTRRAETERRLSALQCSLSNARKLVDGKACAYVTGSFARGEATSHSDLDLFIVGREVDVEGKSKRALSHLDEICVKAELIGATRSANIPDFSGDGEYLDHYTIEQLVGGLGTPEDDANNTFTARMLLLLESRSLLGEDVHADAIDRVLDRYWRDYDGRHGDFVPAFLANDILRMWRTFCVNYEARTQTEPDERRAKRKLKNYKLKHSRLLTCYSAVAHLSAEFSLRSTVTPDAAKALVAMSPTQRLEWVANNASPQAKLIVDQILEAYEFFLESTDKSEQALIDVFLDPDRRKLLPDSSKFGELVAELLLTLGKGTVFHRLLLV